MKIIKTFLFSWAGWLLLIVLVRLAIGELATREPNMETRAADELIKVALSLDEPHRKALAFDSLYQLASRWPEQKQHISLTLADKKDDEVKRFLRRLESSPRELLVQSLAQARPDLAEDMALLAMWTNMLFALLLVLGLPLFIARGVNKKSLSRIFGRFGWQKLLLANLLLWGGVIFGFCFTAKPVLIQALPATLSFWVFYRLVKNRALVLFFGIRQPKARKAFTIFIAILASLFLPYFAQRDKTEKISDELVIQAINQAVKDGQKNVAPLLLSMLDYSSAYSVSVVQKTIQGLGDLGEDRVLPHLLPFLSSSEPSIQESTLEAMKKILRRSQPVVNSQKKPK